MNGNITYIANAQTSLTIKALITNTADSIFILFQFFY